MKTFEYGFYAGIVAYGAFLHDTSILCSLLTVGSIQEVMDRGS